MEHKRYGLLENGDIVKLYYEWMNGWEQREIMFDGKDYCIFHLENGAYKILKIIKEADTKEELKDDK